MKLICGALVAAVGLMSAAAAYAAEYQHFNGEDPHWRSEVRDFLVKYRPSPENISAGFSGDADLHVYVVPGQFTGTYTLLHLKHRKSKPNSVVKSLLDGGNGKILGYQGDGVYMLTWTRPTS